MTKKTKTDKKPTKDKTGISLARSSRDNLIPLFELDAMDSDIRGRALTLYGLEIVGAQEDSDFYTLAGAHPDSVRKELVGLRNGKTARVKELFNSYDLTMRRYQALINGTRSFAARLSDAYHTAFTECCKALRRECDTWMYFIKAAQDAGWKFRNEKGADGRALAETIKAEGAATRETLEKIADKKSGKKKPPKKCIDALKENGFTRKNDSLAKGISEIQRLLEGGRFQSVNAAAQHIQNGNNTVLKRNGEVMRASSLAKEYGKRGGKNS